RIKQLARRDEHVGAAIENIDEARQRAIDDYNKRNAHRIRNAEYEPGTWVLLHETWLDAQHGHKGARRWAGPYIVLCRHQNGSYALCELDGSILRASAPANRVKLFYYRPDFPFPRGQPADLFTLADRLVLNGNVPIDNQRTCNMTHAHNFLCQSGAHAPPIDFIDDVVLVDLVYWGQPQAAPGLERWPTREALVATCRSNLDALFALQDALQPDNAQRFEF
ncbi:hypothetical protein C8Q76DRAFT_631305, partial [Earliella scabrosa]